MDPEITAMVKRISLACPTLLASQSDSESLNEAAILEEPSLEITPDEDHLRPAGLLCISPKYVVNELSLPVRPSKLPAADPFPRMLREAYTNDYNMPNLHQFGDIPLQWCQKLCFTDRYTAQPCYPSI